MYCRTKVVRGRQTHIEQKRQEGKEEDIHGEDEEEEDAEKIRFCRFEQRRSEEREFELRRKERICFILSFTFTHRQSDPIPWPISISTRRENHCMGTQ